MRQENLCEIAIVRAAINIAQLADQRVARVCAGALIFEGVFRHFLKYVQERSFVDSRILERFRNAERSVHLANLIDERVDEFFRRISLQAGNPCNLSVALVCDKFAVFRLSPSPL